MSLGEIVITIIIGVSVFFFMVYFLNPARARDSISNQKKDQKYVFYIKVTLSDSCFREFEFYSDYPYKSITEMLHMANKKEEKEFIEFHYQKEQVILNRTKIISVTMKRSLTGIEKEKTKKNLRDRIRTIKKDKGTEA